MWNAITYFICNFVSHKRWYDTLGLLRWNGSCSSFPLRLTGVHPSGADRRCAPRMPCLCWPSPSLLGSCPHDCTAGPVCSSLSPAPGAAASSCALTAGNLERMPTRLLFFLGASSAAALLDSQGHTQKCCSSHLDFSSFCSRCLFNWSLSLLMPVPGTKINYFSFLDYFKQNMLPLVLISSARCCLRYSCSETK